MRRSFPLLISIHIRALEPGRAALLADGKIIAHFAGLAGEDDHKQAVAGFFESLLLGSAQLSV